jgi:hemerythrin-like domain-containing protein
VKKAASKSKSKKQSKTKSKVNARASSRSSSASKMASEDIIQLILQDHKPLKQLISVLKDSDVEFAQKEPAFKKFAPLLVCHAKPEEESLYMFMKGQDDLRSEGLEGDTEHMLADQLVEEIKRTEDEDTWMAKAKVLAELVEHHIEEEESDLLPDFKKQSEAKERIEIGQMYKQLRSQYQAQGGDDAPSENVRGNGRSEAPMQASAKR